MSQTHPVPQNLQRGDHDLPEFLNARILERNVRLRTHAIGDEFDFSIKKSTPFGPRQGEAFDEGAKWFPLKVVHFTTTKDAVRSFRALYGKGATAIYGKIQNEGDLTVALGSGEYITGVAGTYTDKITSVKITTSKTVYQAGPKSGEPFNFEVPTDHHVVGFHGYADDCIRSLGVSYSRRLAPASPSFTSSSTDTQPELQPFHSSLCLDDSTRVQWAANNMEAIQQKREQAKADLQPIYTNISDNGENAWVLVESAGQQYYVSYAKSATMWVYVQDQPAQPDGSPPTTKTCTISLGSYSENSNLLGVGGYIWSNIPVSAPSVTIALAFANFMQSLVHDGVTWDMSYAATQLSEAISAVGLSDLAKLIPQSVSKIGGLVVASVLAVALVFALLAFASIVVKEYLLTVNVFNFDPSSTWSSLGWYGDNAELVNGQWENQSLGSFVSSGTGLMPPGFNPAKPQNCMVNYVSTVIRNKSEFLQGLGAAMLFSDTTQGAALKYVVHRAASNAIALKGIPGDPSGFDLEGFYKDAGSWVQAKSTSTQQGTLTITGYTPFLNGAPDDAYEYLVNVGLPSPV
ncbi:Jacalin-type lectin domain-containing protein [Pleurotus pulmonarius]